MLKNWTPTISTRLSDDERLTLGVDEDIVLVLSSAGLSADEELASVIVGTSEHPGVATNSLILSNITASGDLLFLINKGGNSLGVFWADGSTGDTAILAASGQSVDMYIGGSKVFDLTNDETKTTIMGLSGDYWRIGDAATTSNALASEDDLMVSGKLEVDELAYLDGGLYIDGDTLQLSGILRIQDNVDFRQGSNNDGVLQYVTADADALCLQWVIDESANGGNNVPAWVFGEHTNVVDVDLGILDEVVQPHVVTVENAGKYTSSTSMTASGASATMTETGKFANSVIGDVVRVTGGTNATAGWYWITVVTDNDNVNVDRNWCTGAVTDGVMLAYHGLGMITPRAFYLPIYDGAPADSDIDIDMAGALALELSQGNGRLYWRVGAAWHYVDASAGLSMPKEERIDRHGHTFELGDEVRLVVDRINDDGSFHAMPEYAGRSWN